MGRTPEATAKAQATIAAKKQAKEALAMKTAIAISPALELPSAAPTVSELSHDVDWLHIPMLEAERLYQALKKEFERAGRILNARHTESRSGIYICTICNTKHEGLPKGEDLSWKNPVTGLVSPVRTCSEKCWLAHQQNMIEARRARNKVA